MIEVPTTNFDSPAPSPIHLRDLPLLFRRRLVRPDVALLHVSPPDAHGFCTLGTSVDWARGAAEHAQDTGTGGVGGWGLGRWKTWVKYRENDDEHVEHGGFLVGLSRRMSKRGCF